MKRSGKGGAKTRDRHLAKEAQGFDQEFLADSFREPTKEAKQRWEQARRKPGRPRVGRGAQVISVSVEKQLLERSDELAKQMGITRARLIARGLKAVLAAEGQL